MGLTVWCKLSFAIPNAYQTDNHCRMELPPWVVIPDNAYGYPKDWKKMLEYEFW